MKSSPITSLCLGTSFQCSTRLHFLFDFQSIYQNQMIKSKLTYIVILKYLEVQSYFTQIYYSSMNQDKQNLTIEQLEEFYRPRHQGRAFKLQLGCNNGPFLAKDIMHSNKSSACLIAAKNVLQSHQSMSSLLNVLKKQAQLQQKTVRNQQKVQSWFTKCQFIQDELKQIQTDLKKLKIEEDRLKVEMKASFLRLTTENQELTSNFLPLFKNLIKTVRQQSNQQRNIFEQKKRDIESLTHFRNSYLDQLVNCQRKMIKIQDFLGASQTNIEECSEDGEDN